MIYILYKKKKKIRFIYEVKLGLNEEKNLN